MMDINSSQAADRIAALLAAPESRTLDFKRISDKHKKIIETVCAFANSEGGLLALGVGDAKDLKAGDKPQSRLWGVEENPEAFDDLRRLLLQRFTPALTRVHWLRLPCILRDGQAGHVVVLRVEKSDQVHSVVGNGTWTRMDASNRELSAAEIADLTYQRGVKSAETLPMPVALDLLNTDAWRSYCFTRGLADMDVAVRLPRLGLAVPVDGGLQPLLAALNSAEQRLTKVAQPRLAPDLAAVRVGPALHPCPGDSGLPPARSQGRGCAAQHRLARIHHRQPAGADPRDAGGRLRRAALHGPKAWMPRPKSRRRTGRAAHWRRSRRQCPE